MLVQITLNRRIDITNTEIVSIIQIRMREITFSENDNRANNRIIYSLNS